MWLSYASDHVDFSMSLCHLDLMALHVKYAFVLRWCYVYKYTYNIDGLVQERRNSSVLAMELHLSCINPLIYSHSFGKYQVWQNIFVTLLDQMASLKVADEMSRSLVSILTVNKPYAWCVSLVQWNTVVSVIVRNCLCFPKSMKPFPCWISCSYLTGDMTSKNPSWAAVTPAGLGFAK